MPDIEHMFTPPFHLVVLTPMVTPQVLSKLKTVPQTEKQQRIRDAISDRVKTLENALRGCPAELTGAGPFRPEEGSTELSLPTFLRGLQGLQEPFKSSPLSTSITCPPRSGPAATEPLRPQSVFSRS